jgi:hypothetical protein
MLGAQRCLETHTGVCAVAPPLRLSNTAIACARDVCFGEGEAHAQAPLGRGTMPLPIRKILPWAAGTRSVLGQEHRRSSCTTGAGDQ